MRKARLRSKQGNREAVSFKEERWGRHCLEGNVSKDVRKECIFNRGHYVMGRKAGKARLRRGKGGKERKVGKAWLSRKVGRAMKKCMEGMNISI